MATLHLEKNTPLFEGKLQLITKFVVHYKGNADTAYLSVTGDDQDGNTYTLVDATNGTLLSSAFGMVIDVLTIAPVYLVTISIVNSEDLDDLYSIEAITTHAIPVVASA